MTTKSQMSSATLGSKNEDKTRKRKRPDSLDAESTIPTGRLSPSLFPKEDRMDLSKQLQSRQESEHNKKLACKREDAENTILLDKMPEELLESSEEDRMDLSKQLQSRRESEHNKKLACKREDEDEMVIKRKWKEPTPLMFIGQVDEVELIPSKVTGKECRVELGDNRNYAKDETQMSVDLIKPFQDQALVWVPPPPPDPPNPP